MLHHLAKRAFTALAERQGYELWVKESASHDFVLWGFCESAQRRPAIATIYVDTVMMHQNLPAG